MNGSGITPKNFRSALESAAGETGAKTVVSGIIFLAFTFLEQFYAEEAFKCPCYNHANKTEESTNCKYSRRYAIAFILISIAIIFIVSMAIIVTARCVCSKKKTEEYEPNSIKQGNELIALIITHEGDEADMPEKVNEDPNRSFIYVYHGCQWSKLTENFFQSLLISTVWVTVLLFDGDYIACATTCDPYGNATCGIIKSQNILPFSDDYKTNKRISMYSGLTVAGVMVLISAIIKFCSCKGQRTHRNERDSNYCISICGRNFKKTGIYIGKAVRRSCLWACSRICKPIYTEKLANEGMKLPLDAVKSLGPVAAPAALPAGKQLLAKIFPSKI